MQDMQDCAACFARCWGLVQYEEAPKWGSMNYVEHARDWSEIIYGRHPEMWASLFRPSISGLLALVKDSKHLLHGNRWSMKNSDGYPT